MTHCAFCELLGGLWVLPSFVGNKDMTRKNVVVVVDVVVAAPSVVTAVLLRPNFLSFAIYTGEQRVLFVLVAAVFVSLSSRQMIVPTIRKKCRFEISLFCNNDATHLSLV